MDTTALTTGTRPDDIHQGDMLLGIGQIVEMDVVDFIVAVETDIEVTAEADIHQEADMMMISQGMVGEAEPLLLIELAHSKDNVIIDMA